MKLFSAAPSFKFTGSDRQSVEIPDAQMPYDFDKIKWNDGSITVEEATGRIEKKLYPFKEVGTTRSIISCCIFFILLFFTRFLT